MKDNFKWMMWKISFRSLLARNKESKYSWQFIVIAFSCLSESKEAKFYMQFAMCATIAFDGTEH